MWSKESRGGCGVRQRVEWVWSKAESQGRCGEAESQGKESGWVCSKAKS